MYLEGLRVPVRAHEVKITALIIQLLGYIFTDHVNILGEIPKHFRVFVFIRNLNVHQ